MTRIAIVGGGAAGLAMGMQLKRAGHDDFVILERSPGVGGTWHDNRYPGAACDVPSHLYCFSFEPKPDWTHKFSRQPEIEQYFRACVDKHGLAPHLRLGTEVRGARFVDGAWHIETSGGTEVAQALVSGTGQLNRPRTPAFPGLESFAGQAFHSSRWRPDFAAAGKRVIVIGSGASAVQIVPELVRDAAHVSVMQRTPAYVIARNDRAYWKLEKWLFRYAPGWRALYRSLIYWGLEARFTALHRASVMGKIVRWMALRHLKKQISDRALREVLTPDYPVGCKRIVISDDWYPALARDNCSLVTAPIERIAPEGVVTADGKLHAADALVFATGFDTTSFLAPMQIVGKDGVALDDAWRTGAEAHRGVLVSGFPNLFLLYGPNTNLGHNSILFMIECQVRYVTRCLDELARRGARWIDVKREAMARSNAELQAALAKTTWSSDCNSWYKTADGKITNNWSGRTAAYWRATRNPNFDELELGS